MENFRLLPNRFRNRQREKLCNVPTQSFQFDDQFIIHGVIDAANMENNHVDENFLHSCDRLLYHVRRNVKNAGQFRAMEKLFPNLTVIRGNGQQISDSPGLGFGTERDSSESQTTDDAGGTEKIEPVLRNPLPNIHAAILPQKTN